MSVNENLGPNAYRNTLIIYGGGLCGKINGGYR